MDSTKAVVMTCGSMERIEKVCEEIRRKHDEAKRKRC